MKNNNDLDFIKSVIENENVQPPAELDANGVKNIIYPAQPKKIKLTQKKQFKAAVTAAACIVAFVAVGLFASPKLFVDKTTDEVDVEMAEVLPNFKSYSELEKMVKKANKNQWELFNGFSLKSQTKDFAVEESAAEGEAVADISSTFSDTNVQVDGVDEADIIKNDGKYIYYVDSYNSNEVKIYKPEGENVRLVSTIIDFSYTYDSEDDYYLEYNNNIIDMFVSGDRLVLNTNSYDTSSYSSYESYTNTYLYDLSDIENPKMINSFSQSGYYVSSRMVDNQLYIVSNDPEFYYDNSYKNNGFVPRCGVDDELEKIPLENIRYVKDADFSNAGFLIVSSIDVSTCEKTADTQAVFGMSAEIYCNENTMYAASGLNFDDEMTDVFKIELGRDQISFTGHARVRGSVNNQFSMDEYNGFFRIAVTEFKYGVIEGESNHQNRLYIFDDNMEEVSRIDSFAKGESIKAVRFMGDMAYVITYEDIDPLFVIDLSDPQAPEILGEVEISGFSSQLVPVDENTLLGVGYATTPSGFEDMERTDGIKLVLFDVSDKSKPTVLDSVIFENTSSNAQYDHKAISIDKANARYAIDYTDYPDYTDDYEDYYQNYGAITFEINNGKIVVTNKFKIPVYSGYTSSRRCTFLNDFLYVFDDDGEISTFAYND